MGESGSAVHSPRRYRRRRSSPSLRIRATTRGRLPIRNYRRSLRGMRLWLLPRGRDFKCTQTIQYTKRNMSSQNNDYSFRGIPYFELKIYKFTIIHILLQVKIFCNNLIRFIMQLFQDVRN